MDNIEKYVNGVAATVTIKLKELQYMVDKINRLEEQVSQLTDRRYCDITLTDEKNEIKFDAENFIKDNCGFWDDFLGELESDEITVEIAKIDNRTRKEKRIDNILG